MADCRQEMVFSPVHISSFLPLTGTLLKATTVTTTSPRKKTAPVVADLDHLRRILNGPQRLLILDLEFFQAGKQHHISQIAGRLYEQPVKFNYYFFNDQQSGNRQLQFLQHYDVPLSVAAQFTIKEQLSRVVNLVNQLMPDYIVSWDNSLDFKALQQAAQSIGIPADQRFWNTIQPLDLEQLIAQQVWQNQKSLGLKRMCQLLNLPMVEFHQAQNDVRAIEWILQFYSHDLGREL